MEKQSFIISAEKNHFLKRLIRTDRQVGKEGVDFREGDFPQHKDTKKLVILFVEMMANEADLDKEMLMKMALAMGLAENEIQLYCNDYPDFKSIKYRHEPQELFVFGIHPRSINLFADLGYHYHYQINSSGITFFPEVKSIREDKSKKTLLWNTVKDYFK